jgi:hypothetical protein
MQPKLLLCFVCKTDIEFQMGQTKRRHWRSFWLQLLVSDADQLGAILPELVAELIAFDEALNKLATVNSYVAYIVSQYGFTICQAGGVLSITSCSTNRLWGYAKAWLRWELRVNHQNS